MKSESKAHYNCSHYDFGHGANSSVTGPCWPHWCWPVILSTFASGPGWVMPGFTLLSATCFFSRGNSLGFAGSSLWKSLPWEFSPHWDLTALVTMKSMKYSFMPYFIWPGRILQTRQGRDSTFISPLKLQYIEHVIYLVVTIKGLWK